MNDSGRIQTKEYGTGWWFMPVYVMPVEDGERFIEHLERLGSCRQTSIRLVEESFARGLASAIKLIPSSYRKV